MAATLEVRCLPLAGLRRAVSRALPPPPTRHAARLFPPRKAGGHGCFPQARQQDITCDVNFTDLQSWGEEAGLRTIARETQAEFFTRFGVTTSGDPDVLAAAGEAFQVLWQERRQTEPVGGSQRVVPAGKIGAV